MKSFVLAYSSLLTSLLLHRGESFSVTVPLRSQSSASSLSLSSSLSSSSLSMVSREKYFQPHFEVSPAPSKVMNMDRMVACAESDGSCDIDEMKEMMEALEHLNEQCAKVGTFSSNSADCNVEMGEARQTVMHALQSQIGLVEARHEIKDMEVLKGVKRQHQNDDSSGGSEASTTKSLLERYRAIAEYESH